MSYKTTLKEYDLLIRVLVVDLARTDNILKGELEADEFNFGGRQNGKKGRGAGHKTIVFEILERGGIVSVSIVTDVKAESLLNETDKKCDVAQLFTPINGKVTIHLCSVDIVTSVSITNTNSNKEKFTSPAKGILVLC